ncbi:uncharacterized protein MONBRDRAFT_31161 [Monosiga brevicollis MX1]|uniref:PX domain-containing protein n=1 Tax=Monosiga brevicollis TaxID=81824 RepID=A9US36_MONBE|nr:uncharacterized protein MONBRDRAFT_31161 [Monosiga brevicollis MX1]EDQ91710.1 predicted protein [Monosiga brevicollis MX1]|eukprot:XP_001742996.1 hypothetical protein [Monosiga brevicollis MX1]
MAKLEAKADLEAGAALPSTNSTGTKPPSHPEPPARFDFQSILTMAEATDLLDQLEFPSSDGADLFRQARTRTIDALTDLKQCCLDAMSSKCADRASHHGSRQASTALVKTTPASNPSSAAAVPGHTALLNDSQHSAHAPPTEAAEATSMSPTPPLREVLETLATSIVPLVCAHCYKLLIGGKALLCNDSYYHPKCFCCQHCHQPITTTRFLLTNGQPVCYDCCPSCVVCGLTVIENHVMVNQTHYHRLCLRCSACDTPIQHQLFLRDDQVVCPRCIDPIFPNRWSRRSSTTVGSTRLAHDTTGSAGLLPPGPSRRRHSSHSATGRRRRSSSSSRTDTSSMGYIRPKENADYELVHPDPRESGAHVYEYALPAGALQWLRGTVPGQRPRGAGGQPTIGQPIPEEAVYAEVDDGDGSGLMATATGHRRRSSSETYAEPNSVVADSAVTSGALASLLAAMPHWVHARDLDMATILAEEEVHFLNYCSRCSFEGLCQALFWLDLQQLLDVAGLATPVELANYCEGIYDKYLTPDAELAITLPPSLLAGMETALHVEAMNDVWLDEQIPEPEAANVVSRLTDDDLTTLRHCQSCVQQNLRARVLPDFLTSSEGRHYLSNRRMAARRDEACSADRDGHCLQPASLCFVPRTARICNVTRHAYSRRDVAMGYSFRLDDSTSREPPSSLGHTKPGPGSGCAQGRASPVWNRQGLSDRFKRTILAYDIEVVTKDACYTISRRYRQFRECHEAIRLALPGLELPVFPPKIYLGHLRNVADRRRDELTDWLAALIALPASQLVSSHNTARQEMAGKDAAGATTEMAQDGDGANVTDLLAAKQKELEAINERITQVVGHEPERRHRRRPTEERRTSFGGSHRAGTEGELEDLPAVDNNKLRSVVASSTAKRDTSTDVTEAPVLKKVASATVVASRSSRPSLEKNDSKTTARNRRMFGMLMGTLQQASKRAEKKSQSELRYKEVDQKFKEQQEQEREEYRQQRNALFDERREKRNELFRLEQEVELPAWQSAWEDHAKRLRTFIRLKAEPRIFFVPGKHNDQTRAMLINSQQELDQEQEERKKTQWKALDPPLRRRRDGQEAADDSKMQTADDGEQDQPERRRGDEE